MAQTPCDPKDVALAAMATLIRLMGAELVAGAHRDDIDLIERCVRDKLATITIDTCTFESTTAGLLLASAYVERELHHVRSQGLAARADDVVKQRLSMLAVDGTAH